MVTYEVGGVLYTGFGGNQLKPPGLSTKCLLLAFLLLGQENGVDVGQDTSLGDGHASEELVELFVVADGELDQNLTQDLREF